MCAYLIPDPLKSVHIIPETMKSCHENRFVVHVRCSQRIRGMTDAHARGNIPLTYTLTQTLTNTYTQLTTYYLSENRTLPVTSNVKQGCSMRAEVSVD